jgi:short-subunit dehydrogenase
MHSVLSFVNRLYDRNLNRFAFDEEFRPNAYLRAVLPKLKIYWITGASSGIGEALAYELAKPGNALILSARSAEKLSALKEKIGSHAEVALLPFDLADVNAIPEHVENALSFFGQIDVLINNAGFSQRSPAIETAESVEREIMELNYFAPVALSKALLPHFIERKAGHIVVVSSIAGKFGFTLRSSYAAAKHALHGYFEALRLEMKDVPVYITMVCPGRVRTNISYNARKGDGSSHNVLDDGQRKGISAESCAHSIVKAINSKKYDVLIGGAELLPVYLKRFCPPLFYWLIKKINAT